MGDAVMMCRDAGLVEQVQGAAAALQVPVVVTREAEEVRSRWRQADAVFVGADSAAWVAGLGLPVRRGVHVVGRSADEVLGWSVPLDASVLVLPDQAGMISAILDQAGAGEEGLVVRVVGASGGLGVSTLAAGLAQTLAARTPAALVELARCGGGLDVLLGIEHEQGWRWDDLAAATGTLGDIGPRLPDANGLAVVSQGRGGREPSADAAAAVLRALGTSHGVVVVDAGRGDCTVGEHWPHARTLLMVGADVRGVLAARAFVEAHGVRDADLVVRRGPGRTLGRGEVEDALGLPALGVVSHHAALATGLARGLPPLAQRPFARECRRLVEALRSDTGVVAA